MTRPHEETWTLDYLVVANENGKSRFGSGSPVGVDFDEDQACLRLAAQAPAMARLLLEMEWSSEEDCCLFCGRERPIPNAINDADVRLGHTPSCRYALALSAAGIYVRVACAG